MEHEGLVPRVWFVSRLGNGEVFARGEEKEVSIKPISDEDYTHYVKVSQTFGCETFGKYVTLYNSMDVELLAILLEKFVETCFHDFGIDPTKSYTAPGFFWQAMLKMTGVKLELLTDPTKYTFFEKSIRGGVSVISGRQGEQPLHERSRPYQKDPLHY